VSAERAAPEYVREEVRRALASDAVLAELGIDALVLADAIVLHGRIATLARRTRAEEVVRGLFPAYEVRNELVVHEIAPAALPEPIG
jgi:hypothetical protein